MLSLSWWTPREHWTGPRNYIFKSFSGYNTPELSKHRKRSHSKTLKKHVSSLKSFKTVDEGTVGQYEKSHRRTFRNHWVLYIWAQSRDSTSFEIASDDLAFCDNNFYNRVLQQEVSKPQIISSDIQKPIFVEILLQPIDVTAMCISKSLIKVFLLNVCYAQSFGASIGNYYYIWKIPAQVTLENALTENQRVVTDIDVWHTKNWQVSMSQFTCAVHSLMSGLSHNVYSAPIHVLLGQRSWECVKSCMHGMWLNQCNYPHYGKHSVYWTPSGPKVLM